MRRLVTGRKGVMRLLGRSRSEVYGGRWDWLLMRLEWEGELELCRWQGKKSEDQLGGGSGGVWLERKGQGMCTVGVGS